jgi:hypothetical protein
MTKNNTLTWVTTIEDMNNKKKKKLRRNLLERLEEKKKRTYGRRNCVNRKE